MNLLAILILCIHCNNASVVLFGQTFLQGVGELPQLSVGETLCIMAMTSVRELQTQNRIELLIQKL